MSQPEPTPPRRPGFLLSREGVSGLFLLLCAGLVGLEASGLAMGRGRMVGPGYFPMILAGLLAMFGATLLVQAWRGDRVAIALGPLRPPAMMVLSIAAFGLLFPLIGADGAITVLIVLAALAESGRRPLELAVLSVVLVALIWLVFRLGLNLQLPMWPGDRG